MFQKLINILRCEFYAMACAGIDDISFRQHSDVDIKVMGQKLCKSLLKSPKPPALPAPKEIPNPNDELLKQKKRKEAAVKIQQSGRESTILSDKGIGA